MSSPSDSDRKCTTFPKIKEVRAYIKDAQNGSRVGQGGDCHDVPTGHWIDGSAPHMPIANPMSCYELYEDIRASWGINSLGSLVVEVETTEGDKGVGVSIGGAPGCYIVEHHLSRFIEGQNPADIELMWDQMYRATLNYGRKGLPLQAISAVDLALWDLLGHLRREPVYQMLGGRTKPFLPVYSTTCDALQAKKFGFVGAKIGCPYGPSAGDEGLKNIVHLLRATREQVGPDFPLMLDCYMALTLPYAIRLAKELTELKFKWIEEALPPDDYQGYRELRHVCRTRTFSMELFPDFIAPDKGVEFRKMDQDPGSAPELVKETYRKMHTHQTVEFGKAMLDKWTKFTHVEMTVMEALERLNKLVDESDPDFLDLPNSYHAFQTAELLRHSYPDLDWLQVVGLVHDIGKVMGLVDPSMAQWSLVGDTFPVGCEPQESVVFRHLGFTENPDTKDPRYNTKLGIYEEKCGLENVMMSWGHDEYLYRVLRNHAGMKLPEEGLFIIRYHSFYPLHHRDDYQYLLSEADRDKLKWLKLFQKFDLYSKDETALPDTEQLRDYYQKLIDKYIPGKIKF